MAENTMIVHSTHGDFEIEEHGFPCNFHKQERYRRAGFIKDWQFRLDEDGKQIIEAYD